VSVTSSRFLVEAPRAAELSSNAFPDGVWLVDLAEVRHRPMVAATAAAVFGLPD